jgi:hypothetical protein
MANRLLFFVAMHKDAPLPMRSDIFAALGLGGYHPTTTLEALSDDSGDSISHKNAQYSELTSVQTLPLCCRYYIPPGPGLSGKCAAAPLNARKQRR